MSCEKAQELISLLLDREAPVEERESVLAHVDVCRECGARLATFQKQRAVMRKMVQAPVPELLSAKLRVVASHERQRQLARVNFRERMRRVGENISLAFDNLMRPVALPFTGGILSALLLFSLMVPFLSFTYTRSGGYDFSTDPRGSIVVNPYDEGPDADASDFPLFASPNQPKSDYVNIVNLTIDETGKVVDWAVVRGQLTDEMKTIILLSTFEPATNFGIKTSGTIQLRQGLPPCKYAHCSATVRG